MAISTRGSCDALLALLHLLLLRAAQQDKPLACGAWLGLAAHFRLFPAIHGAPLMLSFLLSSSPLLLRLRRAFLFAAAAGVSFLALGGLCYAAFGPTFLPPRCSSC